MTLPDKFCHILGNINIPDNDGLAILTALREGDVLLANDGSFLQKTYTGTLAHMHIN
jgi:hypothetical protein